jgi:hypothetical protein
MATFCKRGPYQWEARIRKKGYPTTCKTFEIKADAGAGHMNKSLLGAARKAASDIHSCSPKRFLSLWDRVLFNRS